MMASSELEAADGTLACPAISVYKGELLNSHGRTLTDESYVMHGILSGTWYFKKMKEQLNLVNNVPDPRAQGASETPFFK
jgi:hypothetical protein